MLSLRLKYSARTEVCKGSEPDGIAEFLIEKRRGLFHNAPCVLVSGSPAETVSPESGRHDEIAFMRILFKSISVFLLLSLYSLVSLCIMALPADRSRRLARLTGNSSFFARLALRVLGIRVLSRRTRRKGIRQRRPHYLIIANHLTYVDILVVASLMPSVFITSVELKQTFPLGVFAWLGGCLFVERRSPAGLKREIREIEQVLSGGTSVVLFPEGTTSNGETVRPFKNSLITAVIRTGTNILPVCLRYRAVNGQPVNRENRDSVYYYGGTTFFEHLPRLLALKTIDVECFMLQPISTHQHHSRKDLAARAHALIRAAYHERPTGRHRES
jgi:1-acyl-sn-glycerol-3-phosphate acyltransferase